MWKSKCTAIYTKFPRIGHHHVTVKQLIRHTGSFNGKDFKAIAQVGPMLYGNLFPQHRKLWIALSLLTKMLYTQPQNDMETFTTQLDFVIDIFCKEALKHFEKIKTHMKFHSMVHITQFFRLYGPLQLYDAEQSESENGTIRKFIQNSNRHNSTRDMAERYAVYENAKGLLQGLWTINENGLPICPGSAVQSLLADTDIRNTVKDFRARNDGFMLKADEFCWIGKDLFRIVAPKKVFTQVQQLEPTGENDCFGNLIFKLNTQLLSVPSSEMGDYAHVFHHCVDCSITDKIIHSDDNLFVLNAFRLKENDPECLSRCMYLLM
jgi:hypothetical protein